MALPPLGVDYEVPHNLSSNCLSQPSVGHRGNRHGGAAYRTNGGRFRTSKLVGSMVYNQANENIGSIEDIILKPDGTLGTVVLSVGGFLGIGNKYVAVPFSSLKITRENDSTGNLRIVTEGSKDLLKALPDYQFYKA